MDADKRWLLVREVAERMRVSESTVRHWMRTGQLQSIKPGRRRLIAEAELSRFMFAEGGR